LLAAARPANARNCCTSDSEGAPARAATVIVGAVTSAAPPFQLVLGRRAYDMAYAGLRQQRDELETQRELARSIDFDAG
jgi:hypothetical protein